MFSCLLKRVLPFTLTLIIGSFLGVLFNFHGTGGRFVRMTARLEQEDVHLGLAPGRGYGHSCRMYRRDLVTETKPLFIHLIPHARVPRYSEAYPTSMLVRVIFGADGKVQDVEQLQPLMPDAMQKAAESAARLIYFEPETINGVPVTVTKDMEIPFFTGGKPVGSD